MVFAWSCDGSTKISEWFPQRSSQPFLDGIQWEFDMYITGVMAEIPSWEPSIALRIDDFTLYLIVPLP